MPYWLPIPPLNHETFATRHSTSPNRPVTVNLGQVLIDEGKTLEAEAYLRAVAVADRLTQAGFAASPVGEYRAYRQTADQRQLGYQRFQTVLIRPGS